MCSITSIVIVECIIIGYKPWRLWWESGTYVLCMSLYITYIYIYIYRYIFLNWVVGDSRLGFLSETSFQTSQGCDELVRLFRQASCGRRCPGDAWHSARRSSHGQNPSEGRDVLKPHKSCEIQMALFATEVDAGNKKSQDPGLRVFLEHIGSEHVILKKDHQNTGSGYQNHDLTICYHMFFRCSFAACLCLCSWCHQLSPSWRIWSRRPSRATSGIPTRSLATSARVMLS